MVRCCLGLGAMFGLLVVALPVFGETGEEETSWPVVAETGTLFVTGKELEPPFVFDLDGDTLRVNNRPLVPLRESKPAVEVSEGIRRRHDLLARCFERVEAMLENGLPTDAVRDTVMSILGRSPLVAGVTPRGEDRLSVSWLEGPPAEEVWIPSGPAPPGRPWADVCRDQAVRYRGYLVKGWTLIIGAHGEKCLPPGRGAVVERDLEVLFRTRDPSNEDLQVLPPDLAEEFLEVWRERGREGW